MIFKPKSATEFARPRITPDPNQAALLQQKMAALSYYPANGFHKDVRQTRQLKLVRGSLR